MPVEVLSAAVLPTLLHARRISARVFGGLIHAKLRLHRASFESSLFINYLEMSQLYHGLTFAYGTNNASFEGQQDRQNEQ
ncbi:MAG: hypothetical protein ACREFR_15920 [Limisphaerales bacterium]